MTSFDHLVTDGYSQARLVDELLGAADGNGGGGSFREWVEWQRGEYPDPRSETSGAVSYTHLDVYKRQRLRWLWRRGTTPSHSEQGR